MLVIQESAFCLKGLPDKRPLAVLVPIMSHALEASQKADASRENIHAYISRSKPCFQTGF